jgi:hypothetical protein
MGLRHTFPVQTNSMVFSRFKVRQTAMQTEGVQGVQKFEGFKEASELQNSLNSFNSSNSMPRLNAPTAYDYVQALYRLLAVQSGSSSAAESAVRQMFLQAFQNAGKQLERLDFDGLFRTAYQSKDSYPRQANPELNGWASKLHQLPEPERFSMTLFCLEILPPATIAEITGTTLETLAERVEKARSELNNHLS